jgi:hypothetical protein
MNPPTGENSVVCVALKTTSCKPRKAVDLPCKKKYTAANISLDPLAYKWIAGSISAVWYYFILVKTKLLTKST